ncbi:chaperonin 10-like protein [Mucor mucedo]|uniref:chaperonin 10-like protein n=1 Tax=Mucor mucedo TaxID=29922 RepID=UPI00221EE48E|nr:chaperonin 10-like protein [Mucor mucedo]KAI7869821.1 chaperonin 10-like protein [Mucor mucedo]
MSDTFIGWACTAKDKPLIEMELNLRGWDDNCVELDVTHCGMCGTDMHALDEDWGPTDFPCVVGHEIVGIVTRIGRNVTNLTVGDRGGVGPFAHSCHKCQTCLEGHENICENGFIGTYNANWDNGDKTYGGFANKWRGDYRWAFKVPDSMASEDAASFFCAGITSYAPLRNNGVNEKSVVGVLGIGGLGHFGILFAKAMGATVIALSHNDKKRNVCNELGCDDFINVSNKSEMAKYRKKLTHILGTGSGEDFKWEPYFDLLRVNGIFMNVNSPGGNLPEFNAINFVLSQVSISGSAGGSPTDMEHMLEFAAEKKIKPWVTKYKMADVNQAIRDFRDGKPRFRFILEN